MSGAGLRRSLLALTCLISTSALSQGDHNLPTGCVGISCNPDNLPFTVYEYVITKTGLHTKAGGKHRSSEIYAPPDPKFVLCTFRAWEHSNQGNENAWTVRRIGDSIRTDTEVSGCDQLFCNQRRSVYVDIRAYYFRPGTWSTEQIVQAINSRLVGRTGRATRGGLPWPDDIQCGDQQSVDGRQPAGVRFPIAATSRPGVYAALKQLCVSSSDGSEVGHVLINGHGDNCQEAGADALTIANASDPCRYQKQRTNLYMQAGRREWLDTPGCRWHR